MAGTVKALFHELDLDVSDAQIAKAFPSRATLAGMEPKVAADCLLSVCQEIKDDFGKDMGTRLTQIDLGLTCDHGHRKDQDHFVKLISWAGFDENGNWTIKFYCVDVVCSVLYLFLCNIMICLCSVSQYFVSILISYYGYILIIFRYRIRAGTRQ
jgi:hypothetical protein